MEAQQVTGKTGRKKAMRALLPAALLVTLALLLAACSGQQQSSVKNDGAGAKEGAGAVAPAPGDAGFQEFPIGDPQEAEGMNIAGVYFQAVDMEPAEQAGLGADDADIHIEADITALKNN